MALYREDAYFTDEMRYGTRTHCKRRWTRQAHRPVCQMKLGYLYVAICPFTGDVFAMFFSHLDKACFAVFLEHLQDYLKQAKIKFYSLVMVPWLIPHRIGRLMKLTGKSFLLLVQIGPTQLNPVDRFFAVPAGKELRRYTANRIFDSKEQIEDLITKVVRQYQHQPQLVIKLTLYP